MGGQKKDSHSEMRKASRIAIFSIIAMVLVILALLVRGSRSYTAMLEQNRERLAWLEDAISEEEERTDQIEQLRAYMQSDEYQQMQARSRLGMVLENEIIFEEE